MAFGVAVRGRFVCEYQRTHSTVKKENTIRAMAYGVAVRGCLVSARLSSVKRDLLIWQETY